MNSNKPKDSIRIDLRPKMCQSMSIVAWCRSWRACVGSSDL